MALGSKKRAREAALDAARERLAKGRQADAEAHASREGGVERPWRGDPQDALPRSQKTREQLIAELERKERALANLWDVFERQERELKVAKARVAELEGGAHRTTSEGPTKVAGLARPKGPG